MHGHVDLAEYGFMSEVQSNKTQGYLMGDNNKSRRYVVMT